jgi:Protein of unknown function (DUF2510)
LIELVRSRAALALIVVASLLAALSNLLLGIGYLTLSRSSESAFDNFSTASAWILFGAAIAALMATCTVGWKLILDQRWITLYGVGTACVATLFFTIGVLVLAIQVNGNSNAGNVVAAVGVGIWALLCIVVAARRSIAQHALSANSNSPQTPLSGVGEPTYWLIVGGALVFVAVAFGLPGPTLQDATPGVVAGILGALGVGAIAIVLAVARTSRLLTSTAVPSLVAGLLVYALSRLVYAINSAVVFTPSTTLTSFKVWATITVGIAFVAWLVIAFSAWLRVGGLSRPEMTRTAGRDGADGFEGQPGSQAQADPTRINAPPSSPPAPSPPAGWYPDPENGSRSRWWDGRAWTEHLAPAAPSWPPSSPNT